VPDSSDADPEIDDVIREFVNAGLAHVHTMELGKVQTFDSTSNPPRADIKLAVRRLRYAEDATIEQYDPVILPDVPIAYPKGGGATTYFELDEGDEVIVFYSERDIDNAIETGEDLNDAATFRRHSDMDPIAYPMSWSNSVPLAARGDGYIIEHDTLIQLGTANLEFATTGQRVLSRLALIEAKVNAIIAAVDSGGDTISGTVSALSPLTNILDLIGTGAKVKIET